MGDTGSGGRTDMTAGRSQLLLRPRRTTCHRSCSGVRAHILIHLFLLLSLVLSTWDLKRFVFCDGARARRAITGVVIMMCGGTIDACCQRQHLHAPSVHTVELVAATSGLHRLVPIRGKLQEIHAFTRLSRRAQTPGFFRFFRTG